MRVYFVGGSGVGKTTLANHVHKKTGLPILRSAVRQVMAERGDDIPPSQKIFADLDAADNFQHAVWMTQLQIESEHPDFVADRAFEAVAYTADHSRVAWQMTRNGEFSAYLERLRDPDCLIFFVRPERSIVEAAADGVRDPWIGWDCVNRIDGIVQYLLESNEIRYVPVRGASLRDRYRLVETVLAVKGLIKW